MEKDYIVKQVAVKIPKEYFARKNGFRIATMAKDLKNERYIHELDQVVPTGKAAKKITKSVGTVGSKIGEFVKGHKVLTLVLGAAVAGGTALSVYFVNRNKNNPKNLINRFNKVFGKYLNAIENGKVNNKVLDDLIEICNQIIESDNQLIYIKNTEFKQLIEYILDYTKKLANVNNVKIKEIQKEKSNNIIDLEKYLEIQKKIINRVA